MLKLNPSVNDIFYKSANSGEYNVGETNNYFHRNFISKYFKLRAALNLGNLEKSVYKTKATWQSE